MQDQAGPGRAASQQDQLPGGGHVDELHAGQLEVDLVGVGGQRRDRLRQQAGGAQVGLPSQAQSRAAVEPLTSPVDEDMLTELLLGVPDTTGLGPSAARTGPLLPSWAVFHPGQQFHGVELPAGLLVVDLAVARQAQDQQVPERGAFPGSEGRIVARPRTARMWVICASVC